MLRNIFPLFLSTQTILMDSQIGTAGMEKVVKSPSERADDSDKGKQVCM